MRFHDELNPKLWDGQQLKRDVFNKLNEIADAFIEFLNIPEESILDIRITGSSANYNYTEYSDLDLHLIVDYEKVHEDCPLVEKYLWAHKSEFNKDHDISIYGVQVELYAEDSTQTAISSGSYSIMYDEWIASPEKIEPTNNDEAVQTKYQELKMACENCQDADVADELLDKIYIMRKAGLAEAGEFSTENMAFKLLRNDGIIEQLKKLKKQKFDKELSLENFEQLTKELNKMNENTTIIPMSIGTIGIELEAGKLELDPDVILAEFCELMDIPYDEAGDFAWVKEAAEKFIEAGNKMWQLRPRYMRTNPARGFYQFCLENFEQYINPVNEDLATLEKKMDSAQDDIKTMIKDMAPTLFTKMDKIFKEALGEDNLYDEDIIFSVGTKVQTAQPPMGDGRVGTVTKIISDDVVEVDFPATDKLVGRQDRYYTSELEILYEREEVFVIKMFLDAVGDEDPNPEIKMGKSGLIELLNERGYNLTEDCSLEELKECCKEAEIEIVDILG